MPQVESFDSEAELLQNWSEFMKFRDDVLKALEEARNAKLIGKSFEAYVDIYPAEHIKAMFNRLNADIRQILIVSKLNILDSEAPDNAEESETAELVVKHAEGTVCDRCRMTRTDVDNDANLPKLCGRCTEIVEESFADAIKGGFED